MDIRPCGTCRRCRVLRFTAQRLGTSLALVGAYLLAGELGPSDSFDANQIAERLQRYQTKMRPYVDKCQDIPNRVDRFAPNSASDITMNIGVMKWMQRWPFRPIAARLWFTVADSIELPNYSMTSTG